MLKRILLVVLSCAIHVPIHADPGAAGCGSGSWIAGTTDICSGVLVYRDYVYDDYGASIGDPFASSIGSSSAGRVRYTADVNSADLVALRLSVVGGNLHVSFEMNSLFNADSTFAALAIDTDNDADTGGGPWADLLAVEQPHGSGMGQPLVSSGWEQVHVFETGDPDTNLIEGIIPLPPGDTWRLQAVTGIKSRRVVMNVAFRADNGPTIGMFGTTSHYFDAEQARVLATTDISEFGAVVEVAKLLGGVTEPAPAATGFRQRVYESAFTIHQDAITGEIRYDQDGEGVSYAGVEIEPGLFPVAYHFLGKYQPYGIYIPEQGGPHGLQLALHGANQTHEALVAGPGMQQNMGEAYNVIVATPLGRGPAGWYYGISERDVLDVMTDIELNYPVDPDRVFAAGYSMGGYGAFRMATMYPDRFAGYSIWTGALARGGLDTLQTLQNTRYVPGALLYGGADELVRFDTFYLPLEARFLELGYEGILYLHPTADHFTLNIADEWKKEAAYTLNRTRVRQPARVTFRSVPFTWSPEVGVVHDKAYWVSDLVGHNTDAGDFVDVDLVTFGCGGSLQVRDRLMDGAGPDPVPWTSQEFDVVGATPLTQGNRIEGSLSNVASLTINVDPDTGACLGAGAIEYEVTTDGATTIAFSDGREVELPDAGTWTGSVDPLPNTDPDASDDSASTEVDTAVTIDVLANDSDADGDPLAVTAVSAAAHGTVALNPDGTVTYSPDSGFIGEDAFGYDIADGRGGTDSATVTVSVTGAGADGDGRVHGAGYWDRGTGGQHDKIDFSFDARVDHNTGLRGKLKLHDKALDLKIDGYEITSLSTGEGESCDGLVLDGNGTFVFTAVGDLQVGSTVQEDVVFRACGVDNGKHGKAKNGQAADVFHVEVAGGYSSGSRTPDNGIDGGNVHLHDAITTPAESATQPEPANNTSAATGSQPSQAQSDDEVMVLDLDPLLLSQVPAGSPMLLVATAHTPSGLALDAVPVVLNWSNGAQSGEVVALTNAAGIAVFSTSVPAGEVTYVVRSGELDSNGVRVTGF